MKEKLTHKLHRDYPEIFPKQFNGYRLGFECGNGWYEHINALCASIMLFCKDHGDTIPKASQVKEKYGSLRFYVQSASNEVFDIIDRFELESQYVCELCGKRGRIRDFHGWYVCLCDEHYIKRRDNDYYG